MRRLQPMPLFFSVLMSFLLALTANLVVGTIAACFLACKPARNYGSRTPDSGVNGNRICRTIKGASAAFHTKISLGYSRFPPAYNKDAVGTDFGTHTAANTFFRVKNQRCDIFQIHLCHTQTLLLLRN
jgi:hypothetical protein